MLAVAGLSLTVRDRMEARALDVERENMHADRQQKKSERKKRKNNKSVVVVGLVLKTKKNNGRKQR